MAKLFHNNIYFGDKSKLEKVTPVLETADAKAVPVPVRLYIAQYNFVDAQAKADNVLPLLPGQAQDRVASPVVYRDVSVTSGTTFENVLLAAAATPGFISNLDIRNTVIDGYNVHFLLAFDYAGETFGSVTTSSYSLTPDFPPVDPLLHGMWTGWDNTYFDGIHRPASVSSYPELAINQYVIIPKIGNARHDFVIDFTKSQLPW